MENRHDGINDDNPDPMTEASRVATESLSAIPAVSVILKWIRGVRLLVLGDIAGGWELRLCLDDPAFREAVGVPARVHDLHRFWSSNPPQPIRQSGPNGSRRW